MRPVKQGLIKNDCAAVAIAYRMASPQSMMLLINYPAEVIQAPLFPTHLPFLGAKVMGHVDEQRAVAKALYVDIVVRSFHLLLLELNGRDIPGLKENGFWEAAELVA